MEEALFRTGPSWAEKFKYWEEHKEEYAEEALFWQTKAVHWKKPPVLVGGVALGWSPNGPVKVFGFNHKPKPGSKGPRNCMEEMIEGHAFNCYCDTIVGIATAASYQEDDVYKKDIRGTLCFCANCRQRIYRMVTCDDTYLPQTRIYAQRVDSPYNVIHTAEYTIADHIQAIPPEEIFMAFNI